MSDPADDFRPDVAPPEPLPAMAAGPRPKIGRYLALFLLVLAGVAASGIVERDRSEAKLSQWTVARSIPSVDLVTPKHATMDRHLTLPADVQAFYTAPIHSRVNGYVKMWYFDIGAKVKAGDVLARIDTPDLDQQYEQAKGELAKAQAGYDLAVVTAARWKAMRVTQAVSQQTADEKASDAQAQHADVAVAQAHLDRIKAMEDFKDITAPFDGVVTDRRVDVGALVSATSTSDKPLFQVASTDRMRVYVRVPQVDAAQMHKGLKVTLKLPQYPGRRFVGTVDTTSSAISDVSRALLVEAIFPNADGLLTSGAYAQARFDLPLDQTKFTVPASAMIFRNEEPEVAVVEGNKVTLKPIVVGVDLGHAIEVASGLDAGDRIIRSPEDSIATGDDVKVETVDGRHVDAATAAVVSPLVARTSAVHKASK